MALNDQQRKLFEAMLQKKGVAQSKIETIPKYVGDEPVRLTYQQEGIWFLDQLNPGQYVYNVPCCARIRGKVDKESLEQALASVIDRHDALRTRFEVKGGVPILAVQNPGDFHVSHLNFSSLPIDKAEEQVLYVAREQCQRPFDLASDETVRAFLVCLAPSDFVLIIVMHHIVTDGWSMGIFLREFEAAYDAYTQGREPQFEPLPIEYKDYANWIRNWLSGENLERLTKFWKKHLDGAEDIRLPWDRERQKAQSNAGAHTTVNLSKQLTAKVASFSRGAKVTRFVTLMAAFRVMLHSYSRQKDIVVGSPLACRTFRELEPLIGYFVNVMPMRCDLDGNPTFEEIVARENKVNDDVQSHQDLPFTKLVQDLGMSRRDSANPVYQVQFTLLEPKHSPDLLGYGLNVSPNEKQIIGGLQFSPMPVDNAVAKFDIVLLLWDRADGIGGSCEYDTSLFDAATVDQMMTRFVSLVGRLMENPQQRLSELVSEYIDSEDETVVEKESRPGPKKRTIGPRKRKRALVSSDTKDWVKIRPMFDDQEIPIVISPKFAGVDLGQWAETQRSLVDKLLLEHRALVFRGFDGVDVAAFENFVMTVSDGKLLEYKDRTTPRQTKGKRVYTSTVHPAEETINAHNEGTYWIRWPLRLFFCCQVASETGGETPIADVRNVYKRLSEDTVEKFASRQMMLVRNFNDGFGLPWQDVFQTDRKTEVESYCNENNIIFEWKGDDRLRTKQIRPAIRRHPETGEHVWFNHAAFFHHTTLSDDMRESLVSELGPDGLPYATYYGDGSEIEPEVAAELREAYAKETIKFAWQNGDVMMLDNMSISHAREPYTGDRDVVVCMTNSFSPDDMGNDQKSALESY